MTNVMSYQLLSLSGSFIKRTPISISTGGFMPPTNFALAKFPAQIYDAVGELIGEVAQSQINVFDNHAKLVDGLQASADFVKRLNI
jgi:hypothetical protein